MLRKLICVTLLAFLFQYGNAQCAADSNQAQLNWEYLDFFPSAGHASYTNLAQSQTQYFTFGTQRVTFSHNYTGSNAPGEDLTNTAKTGTYGSGMDVKFVGDGNITMTWQSAVQNLKFTLYDIDYDQRLTVTAFNGATPVNVSMAKLSGTVLTITGNNTTTAVATSNNTAVLDATGTDGTVNIDIAGPVTSVVISLTLTATKTTGPADSREYGYVWLSKVLACSSGSFPANYYSVAQPLPGQPGYVLAVRNNEVYYVDPATGIAKLLFVDPGHTNINSMGYDPVNNFLYYTYSLTGASGTTNANNRALRRYDYNMDTMGVVINDVRNIGIPTFDVGVESGGAGFYNGSLYLGIEASNSSSYESMIWKVDFNSSFAPVTVSQQFGIDGNTQDWADFGVTNGTIYNFDGHSSSPDFHHINLLTNIVTGVPVASGIIPRQTGIDYTGQVYNIGPPSTGTAGYITPYNYAGGLVSASQRSITYNGVAVTGSWGDAAEAFKPKMDFGDAPSPFDVPGGTPGVHEVTNNLRLGSAFNIEWAKRGATAAANMDLDDGLSYTTILNNSGTYHSSVVVYNNTGGNATVAAWIDFNGDSVFTASEGITVTVPSSASPQSVDLFWTGIVTSIPNNSYTYLRIRLTSATNNLTTSMPTGFLADGEIEDYRVLVDAAPLSGKIVYFQAQKLAETRVKLNWDLTEIIAGSIFELQRSFDGQQWQTLHKESALQNINGYSFIDQHAARLNFYRLKVNEPGGGYFYSIIRKVEMDAITQVQLFPNPASAFVKLSIQSDEQTTGHIVIVDLSGRIVHQEDVDIRQGLNFVNLPVINKLPSGVYQANILISGRVITEKFVKSR